jgi:hypothetical protein
MKPKPEASYEVRHAVFNPTVLQATHSPLAQLVAAWERDDWRLVQVIPHHQYESVAVFVRDYGPPHETV